MTDGLWLTKLGSQIDSAAERGDVHSLRALAEEAIQVAEKNQTERAELLYFAANAYSNIDAVKSQEYTAAWEWEKPEATKEILFLRASVSDDQFSALMPERRCQILTNLGNSLNKVGRPVEAIEAWDKAIRIIPCFAMALGNRANGLGYFANSLYSDADRICFLAEAKASFDRALERGAFWDSGFRSDIATAFKARRDYLAAITKPEWEVGNIRQSEDDLGGSAQERSYRRWRLNERLFLNSLNDLGSLPIAASDEYHLPDHAYGMSDPPRFVRYYDIMKQEYVAACALFHQGIPDDVEEYADREILLYDQFDYELSGIRLEKQKTSYRLAYSVLDKIAGFLNEYFSLNRDWRSLSFRNVWYSNRKGYPRTLDGNLVERNNWPLRGLHSVSKDLFDPRFQDVAEPDAKEISELRNAMEHRFLTIHEFGSGQHFGNAHTSVSYAIFCSRAIRLLKMVRSALTYLSMAVHVEERRKNEKDNPNKISIDEFSIRRRR